MQLQEYDPTTRDYNQIIIQIIVDQIIIQLLDGPTGPDYNAIIIHVIVNQIIIQLLEYDPAGPDYNATTIIIDDNYESDEDNYDYDHK